MNQKVNSIAEGLLEARKTRIDESRPGNMRNINRDVDWRMRVNHPWTKPGSKFDVKKREEYREKLGAEADKLKIHKQIYDEIVHSREYVAFINSFGEFGMSKPTLSVLGGISQIAIGNECFSIHFPSIGPGKSYDLWFNFGDFASVSGGVRDGAGPYFDKEIDSLAECHIQAGNFLKTLRANIGPLVKTVSKVLDKYKDR